MTGLMSLSIRPWPATLETSKPFSSLLIKISYSLREMTKRYALGALPPGKNYVTLKLDLEFILSKYPLINNS